jgi:hypothetical protein
MRSHQYYYGSQLGLLTGLFCLEGFSYDQLRVLAQRREGRRRQGSDIAPSLTFLEEE